MIHEKNYLLIIIQRTNRNGLIHHWKSSPKQYKDKASICWRESCKSSHQSTILAQEWSFYGACSIRYLEIDFSANGWLLVHMPYNQSIVCTWHYHYSCNQKYKYGGIETFFDKMFDPNVY